MKKRILWMLLSFLTVLALVLSSCGPAVEEEEEEEEVEVEEEVVEPQYGGTLVGLLSENAVVAPTSWDPADGSNQQRQHASPFLEYLLQGDIEKYGPRGSNEFPFNFYIHIPEKYQKGQLAESWELTSDPLGMIFKLRKGVMFQANEHMGFEPREFTAYDAEFVMNRFRESYRGDQKLYFVPKEGGFEALDRYTLRANFDEFSCTWNNSIGKGQFSGMYPPECVEAGMADWRNQVGTGAFILDKFVSGSGTTYRRNPDWWDKERIINGKKYDVPFIDKVVFPNIPDEATQIAALRTGRIDWCTIIPARYEATLTASSPDLIIKQNPGMKLTVLKFISSRGIFADQNVRRAMMIGTDLQAIVDTIYLKGEVQGLPNPPSMGTDLVCPIEDLPPETKILFDYNPELAKQMLADAGYPDGLQFELNYCPSRFFGEAMVPLLMDMWSKIGVTAIPVAHDAAVHGGMEGKGTYKEAFISQDGCTTESVYSLYINRDWQFMTTDQNYRNMAVKVLSTQDATERVALARELGIITTNRVGFLPLGTPALFNAWWPWVNNYYGEIESGHANFTPMLSLLWLDQDLKAEMGY